MSCDTAVNDSESHHRVACSLFCWQNTTIKLDHTNTDEKVNQLFQVSYPISEDDHAITHPWENKGVSVLKTSLSPSLCKVEKREYANARNCINCYRPREGIPILSYGFLI